jgi:hypothetical protein
MSQTIRRTVEISSNISQGCDHCNQFVGGGLGDGSLATSINHYIEQHGYKLLHVGTQTNHDNDGKPWHNTIAVLGHDNPPALKPPVQVVVGTQTAGTRG